MSNLLSTLTTRLRFLRRGRKDFARARSGVVAVIFALALLPVLFLLGVVVDYSRATTMKSRLQGAVDLAVLRVGSQPSLTAAEHLQIAQQMVAADLGSDATALGVKVTENDLPGGAGWKVSVTGTMQNSILPVVGVSSETIGASAQAAAQLTTLAGTAVTNINIHLLIDTSQSMGVGADSTDQTNMTKSSLQCAYACHSSVAAATTLTDACKGPEKTATISDGVTYAHEQGYSLRIDAVKTALTNFINQAKTNAAATGATINIALYTFASGFTTVQALTDNYTTLTTAVSGLDIASESSGTSLELALTSVQAKVGTTVGDGSSSSKPLTYVVIVSDGLYDDANPLQTSYVAAPTPTCTTTCTCQDDNGNTCSNQCTQDNQCSNDNGHGNNGHGNNGHNNNCHAVTSQTCDTNTYAGSTIEGSATAGSSNSLYSGNVGNTANAGNLYNYALDDNLNLLTGSQTNTDHWSVGAAQTGTLCYPNAGTLNPIGIAPYVLPNTTTVNAPPCIPDPVNGGNFELAPITPSWCTPLTTAGAKVVTLYTTYMLPTPSSTITANLKSTDPSIEQYYDWRVYYMQNYTNSSGQTFLQSLQANMASCASSTADAYTATTSTEINTAMQSIIGAATTTPLHLVK